MEYVIGILAFVFVLGIIVIIHEGGHFFFARRAKVLCREFAFGMGPTIVKKKKGETVYALRAFPIGGFCAIAGEEMEEDPFKKINEIRLKIVDNVIKGFYFYDDEKTTEFPKYHIISYDLYDRQETGDLYMEAELDGEVTRFKVDPQAMMYDRKIEMQIAPYNRTLGAKSKRQRAMIMFGGPLMNFVLAIIVFLIVGLFTTFPDYSSSSIGGIVEGGALENLNNTSETPVITDGNTITKLEAGSLSMDIKSWNDISDFLTAYRDQRIGDKIKVTYTIADNIVPKTLDVNPQYVFNTLVFASQVGSDKLIVGAINNANDDLIDNSQLLKGDEIKAINGNKVTSWGQVTGYLDDNTDGVEMTFTVLRTVDGVSETKDITVKPYSKEMYKLGMESNSVIYGSTGEVNFVKVNLGITPVQVFNLGQSLMYAVNQTGASFSLIFVTFRALFSSNEVGISNLSGPVGIFSIVTSVAKQGFLYVLNLMGMLSVNVGLLNLLPIPALDGGRLVFLGYEAITKKKPSQKVETAMITITMILLFALMIFVTFNDIVRLFQ